MKKLLFAVALMISACFASCNGRTKAVSGACDSTAIDTCACDSCDSTVVDSVC